MAKENQSENPWEHLDTRPAEMFRHPKAPNKGLVVTYVMLFVVVISAVVFYVIQI